MDSGLRYGLWSSVPGDLENQLATLKSFELVSHIAHENPTEMIEITPQLLNIVYTAHMHKCSRAFKTARESLQLVAADPYHEEEVLNNPSHPHHQWRPVSQGSQFSLTTCNVMIHTRMLKADTLPQVSLPAFQELLGTLFVFYGLEDMITDVTNLNSEAFHHKWRGVLGDSVGKQSRARYRE